MITHGSDNPQVVHIDSSADMLQYSHMEQDDYRGFDTRGTSIDEAFSDDFDIEEDVDDVDFDDMDDE